jgi:hypothetical protein
LLRPSRWQPECPAGWRAARGGGGAIGSDMGPFGLGRAAAHHCIPSTFPETHCGTHGLGSLHEDATDFPGDSGGDLLLRHRWSA